MDTRLEAYSCLGQVKDTVYAVGLFVEDRCDLSAIMIRELNSLGELGRKVRDYYNAYKDDAFAREASTINRAILLQLSGWYSLPEDTNRSVLDCHRYLLEVVENSDNMNMGTMPEKNTSIKVDKFRERLKQSNDYRGAVRGGKIKEPFIWTGTKVDLARWLSPLITQKGYGEQKVNDWQEVDNLFEIRGKKISATDLRSALSKTLIKELDWK